MWDVLTKLDESNNGIKKTVLREKLKNTKMTKSNTVTTYLTKITQVRDKLATAREKVTEGEMVCMTLNSFTMPWTPFIKGHRDTREAF